MSVEFNQLPHGAVITADSLKEIREFWKKFEEDFPEHRYKFSNYEEKDGKCIATYITLQVIFFA